MLWWRRNRGCRRIARRTRRDCMTRRFSYLLRHYTCTCFEHSAASSNKKANAQVNWHMGIQWTEQCVIYLLEQASYTPSRQWGIMIRKHTKKTHWSKNTYLNCFDLDFREPAFTDSTFKRNKLLTWHTKVYLRLGHFLHLCNDNNCMSWTIKQANSVML